MIKNDKIQNNILRKSTLFIVAACFFFGYQQVAHGEEIIITNVSSTAVVTQQNTTEYRQSFLIPSGEGSANVSGISTFAKVNQGGYPLGMYLCGPYETKTAADSDNCTVNTTSIFEDSYFSGEKYITGVPTNTLTKGKYYQIKVFSRGPSPEWSRFTMWGDPNDSYTDGAAYPTGSGIFDFYLTITGSNLLPPVPDTALFLPLGGSSEGILANLSAQLQDVGTIGLIAVFAGIPLVFYVIGMIIKTVQPKEKKTRSKKDKEINGRETKK